MTSRSAQAAERVYTLAEAAAIKSVSVDYLRAAIKKTAGNTLAAKKVGKGYRVKASSLDAWFDGLADA